MSSQGPTDCLQQVHRQPDARRSAAMGIPKFYRWLSERCPVINQPLSDLSLLLLPEFDNLG